MKELSFEQKMANRKQDQTIKIDLARRHVDSLLWQFNEQKPLTSKIVFDNKTMSTVDFLREVAVEREYQGVDPAPKFQTGLIENAPDLQGQARDLLLHAQRQGLLERALTADAKFIIGDPDDGLTNAPDRIRRRKYEHERGNPAWATF